MCWSPEITVAFAFLESVCLAVLVYRGRRYDRQNALLILPLLIQEWFQVILWHHLGSSAYECDATNRQVSNYVTCLVCFVPAWICMQPLVHAELRAEHRLMVWSFLAMAIACGVAGALVPLLGWMSSKCTYLGPWRHQIWPVLNMQYNILPGWMGGTLGRMISVGNLLLYMLCSFGGFLSTRPSYVLPCLAAVGLNAQLLIVFLGPEWGSFWCFQASLLSVLALLEPQLFKSFGEINAFAPRPVLNPAMSPNTVGAEELDELCEVVCEKGSPEEGDLVPKWDAQTGSTQI